MTDIEWRVVEEEGVEGGVCCSPRKGGVCVCAWCGRAEEKRERPKKAGGGGRTKGADRRLREEDHGSQGGADRPGSREKGGKQEKQGARSKQGEIRRQQTGRRSEAGTSSWQMHAL